MNVSIVIDHLLLNLTGLLMLLYQCLQLLQSFLIVLFLQDFDVVVFLPLPFDDLAGFIVHLAPSLHLVLIELTLIRLLLVLPDECPIAVELIVLKDPVIGPDASFKKS